MLVSIHKHFYFIIFQILFISSLSAQEIMTLQQCIDSARAHNKLLKVASNNTLISNERYKEATANLIPKISINADYKYNFNLPTQLMPLSTFNPNAPEGQFKEAQFGVPHNIGANLLLTMPVYNPQVYSAVHSSKVAQELSQLQFRKTEETVYIEISNLYYNAQIISNQISFLDSNLMNTQLLLNTIRVLRQNQMAKATDESKMELQLEQIKLQRSSAINKLRQTLAALKFSMGMLQEKNISVETEIRITDELDYIAENSIDLKIANLQRKLASHELKSAKRSLLPSLSLIASYGTQGFGYDVKPNNFLKFFPVGFTGVQFTYPLFSGTVTIRKINQKKLELKNSEMQNELAIDQNKINITNATNQRNFAKQSIEYAKFQIKQARNLLNQTLLLHKNGMATITDVLLSDNSLREAQQNYLSAIIDYLKADVDLKKFTGKIFN